MTRTYKPSRNKNYKKYDASVIEMALQEYNSSNQSFLKISHKYNIPKSVLHRHNTRVMKEQGGQTALSPAEEEYLVEYINVCSEWGYPLEPFDFRLLIKGYLDKMGIEVKRFRHNLPGPDFMSCFLKRHKNKVSTRLSQNIKRARAAVSPQVIEEYFGELETSLQGIPPSNIVNYDETNLTDDPGRKRVLIKRTVKYPERVMNHTKGSTSLMIAAAADGSLLPPYVVYKSQNIYDTWRQNGPKGCRYNCTPSGWFDGNTFHDWVKTIAIPYFNDKIGPKILIGDNLASHLSIDLIKECQESGVKFVFLPANSTHLTQPLDVAFFRPLKSAWRDLLLTWKKTDGRTQATIPKCIFPSLLKKLLKKIECNVSKNILAGFDKCGICPINKQKILDRLPSYTPDLTGFKEVIDENVLSMLKEMRYGTAHTQRRTNKKKKVDVVAGRSVENIQDDESNESGEINIQEVTDNNYGAENNTNDIDQEKFDSYINSEAGPSKQNVERRGKTTNMTDVKQERNKETAPTNQNTNKGVKTTNKSLIKKTKTRESVKNNTVTENREKNEASSNVKTGRGVKTTNRSLIKKTKTGKPIKRDTKNDNPENEVKISILTSSASVNTVKEYNRKPVINEKQNPIICCDSLNTVEGNTSQKKFFTETFENEEIIENVENIDLMDKDINELSVVPASQNIPLSETFENEKFLMDIENIDYMNLDIHKLPVVFEEVEVVTSEKSNAKDKTNKNIPKNKKIQVLSNKIVKLAPKRNNKEKKVKNTTNYIKKPLYYRNDAELLQDLMEIDCE